MACWEGTPGKFNLWEIVKMIAANNSTLDAHGQPKIEVIQAALENVKNCLNREDCGAVELADAVIELQRVYFAKSTWVSPETKTLSAVWQMRDTLATLYPTAFPLGDWLKVDCYQAACFFGAAHA